MSEVVPRRKAALARLDARLRLFLRGFFRVLWTRLLSAGSSFTGAENRHRPRYRRLDSCGCFFFSSSSSSSSLAAVAVLENDRADDVAGPLTVAARSNDIHGDDDEFDDADVVPLKVSLLGDCRIGKTSFMVKYVGEEEEQEGPSGGLQLNGLNLMDKVLIVRGARITFTIWDVGGDHESLDHVPIACRDSVAILIMFDLTSHCTLINSIGWFRRARNWNKTAIPILIGTKFDDFAQLPLEMQWTIVNQARAYAKAMNASLFFSSATHNINVNKIFKFIAARIFNLPWTVERNLTIGEPIIDF